MEFQSGAVRPIGSIEQGWSLIKSNYWTFFLMTLIAIIILFVAAMILGLINNGITYAIAAALGMATTNSGDAGRISAALIPEVISTFISIFTNIVVVTISGALFCGIYAALSRQASSGTAEIGDMFAGFQKVMPCLIVAVVVSVVQFIINIAMLLVGAAAGVSLVGTSLLTGDGQLNPAIFGGLFLVIFAFAIVYIVINVIISALTAFVYPLIGVRDLSGGEALLLSIKSGFANIGGLILLLILMGLIGFGGALVCCVGFFFVAPILSAALFSAFQSVFGSTNNYYQNTPPPPPVFGNQPGY